MKNNTTIIFCHYGYSSYLRFILPCVKYHNPDADIYLLGDEKNEQVARESKINHIYFKDLEETEELKTFNKVYKHIAGKDHGREFWTNFVFKRWYYVYSFIKARNIKSFWHFDSDNLIVTDLKKQEHKFKSYDCTEQCRGICMNGFINSQKVVKDYLRMINSLFQDEAFLATQLKEFEEHPDWAYTEMRAYYQYKTRVPINRIKLNTIIDDEVFDECLVMKENYEIYGEGKPKKVFKGPKGLYLKVENGGPYIKLNSLNMTRIHDDFCEIIFNKSKKKVFSFPQKGYKLIPYLL